MCGIMGSASKENIIENVLLGLKRLEYRGYDSSGIAFISNKQISCIKKQGRIANLENEINKNQINALTAIGHTRWATHGIPNDVNAHPHYTDSIAIVHNGIIENYTELKNLLIKKGYTFKSDTDTEVALYVIDNLLNTFSSNKIKVLQEFYNIIKGSFAIAITFANENAIYGIKNKNPMVVGFNLEKKTNYIASDIYALAGFVNKVSYIGDNEIVKISANNIEIFNINGNLLNKETVAINLDPKSVEKGTYPNYMLKEIHEQPLSLRDNLANHFKENHIKFNNLDINLAYIKNIKIIACGSSYNAGFIAKDWFTKYCNIEISVEISSEFAYKDNILHHQDTLYIFISQSGETSDTLNALSKVKNYLENNKKEATSKIISLVNIETSQIARMSNHVIPSLSGVEMGVAATKSFTSQLLSLLLLALKISVDKNLITTAELNEIYKKDLTLIDAKISNFLQDAKSQEEILNLCKLLHKKTSNNFRIIWLGRGVLYGVSMEACLKAQELSYLSNMCFPAGELKHGPIALLDDNSAVICLSNSNFLDYKTSSSIEEAAARGAKVILISNKNHHKASIFINTEIFNPWSNISSPIFYTVICQLIAYHLTILMGNDADKPRGLAKSVTVE